MNSKITYTPEQKRQVILGIAIEVAALVGFAISMSYFHLFNSDIQYNFGYISKSIVSFSFFVLAAYGAGYMLGKNQLGIVWAKYSFLLFVTAGVIGYLGHKYTPSAQKFFPSILFLLLIFYAGYHPNHSIKQGLKTAGLMVLGLFVLALVMIGLQLFGCYLGGNVSSCSLSL